MVTGGVGGSGALALVWMVVVAPQVIPVAVAAGLDDEEGVVGDG